MGRVISQKRFINEALETHNKLRNLHGLPPLEHDPDLSSIAVDWAEHLALNDKLEYKNSKYKNEHLGENILKADTPYLSGKDITNLWYREGKNYAYDGKFNRDSGHFTQIIWKDTKKLGVGFASTDDNQFYAVFYYYPAGNYKNEFPNNVFPPIQQNYENLPKQQQPHPSSNITPIPSAQRAVLNQNDSSNKPKANGYDQQQPKYKNENISTSNFDSVQAKFIQEALEQHNECRRRHAVDPLVHNPELSKIAQEYANYLAKIRQLKHSTNKYNDQKLGENLAFSYDSTLDFYSGKKATMQWYDEIKDHDFSRDFQPGTGHFTQVVWKTTREVGFGVAKTPNNEWYAVGNYYPPGNLLGTFLKNVPRNVN